MSTAGNRGSARHVLIALNPRAGLRSGQPLAERVVGLLGAEGLRAEVISDVEQLSERSAELWGAGELRCVVAAGGDGTVALVANRTAPGVPLAVLPLGTENLLATQFGLRRSAEDVCRVITQGQTIRLDAGRAGDRLFLVVASCGFDAEVVRRLHRERAGNIQRWFYAKPILESIRSYPYPELRIEWEAMAADASAESAAIRQSISARWAFVVNLPRYAGGLQIAPQASGQDGLLDVCAFKEGSVWSGLRYLSGVWLGQHESWRDCVTCRVQRVRIEANEEVPYQLDGDPGGFLPLEIEVMPNRITLMIQPHHA